MTGSTVAIPAVLTKPANPAVKRRAWAPARSGWLPAGLLLGLTATALRYYGVPLSTTAIFGAYVALAISLPGLLLWRAVHRGSRSLLEDVAAGTAVGYAMEVLAYIPARAIGLPLLELAAPALVVIAFLTIPGLRRYWRGAGAKHRPPALWSWSIAGVNALLLVWSCTKFYRFHFLQWPDNAFGASSEMPFHMALLGEAKHHMPMAVPYVQGEPLYYHWFVYAEMAATSWATGIEHQVLLHRLSLLPFLAAFTVLIAAVARRLTGAWWTGPVAAIVTFFVLAPNPYAWPLPAFFTGYLGYDVADDASLLRPVLWASPTQTFGALLFVPVVLVLLDLLGGHGRDRRRWMLFGGMLVAVMGAKATYLPLLLAALLLVVTVHLVLQRRLHRPALAAGGITLLCLLFAQFVLFGGATQGLTFAPFSTMKIWAMSAATGFAAGPNPPLWRLLLLTGLFLTCWTCIWGGIVGLRRRLLEPRILLLIGLGLAGMGAITVMGHAGLSQGFFFQSARPYLAVAAVTGLAALLPRMTWRIALALLAATAAGGALMVVIRALGTPAVPSLAHGAKRLAVQLTWPYVLLVVLAAALAGLGLLITRSRLPKRWVAALVIALLAGAGLTTGLARLDYAVRTASSEGWQRAAVMESTITEGSLHAGRWLRDHSSPDDLVATNAHCKNPDSPVCTSEHNWIAGYIERRLLVEGWAYTDRVHAEAVRSGLPEGEVPFWRPTVLADNDAAFKTPSRESIGRLSDKYQVRWLFVDESQGTPPSTLADFTTLRYRSGKCAIYEISR